MEYYLAIKNEIWLFATAWMGLEGIMLSEINQTKASTIWLHLYVELKKQNKQTKINKLIDTENKCMVTR